MPEPISDVEMNQLQRSIEVAERDRADTVTIPTRAARSLLSDHRPKRDYDVVDQIERSLQLATSKLGKIKADPAELREVERSIRAVTRLLEDVA